MGNCKIMFDNGGGVSVKFGSYKHYYESGKEAAQDYLEYIKDGNTSGWEGHDKQIKIKDGECPNGGYKTITQQDIEEMGRCTPDYFWGLNEEEFITTVIKGSNGDPYQNEYCDLQGTGCRVGNKKYVTCDECHKYNLQNK